MRSLKKCFLSALLLICTIGSATADVGCALNYGIPSQEVVYFTVIGTAGFGSWTNYGGSPTQNNAGFPTACPRYDYDTALDAGGRCCVNGNCNNTTRTRVNFTPIACPIDDYTPMAMLLVGSAGMFFVKRRVLNLV